MGERWVGLHVSGDKVTMVDVEANESGSPLVLQSDQTWTLQKGDRLNAYTVMYRRVSDYVSENDIQRAVIKASALALGSVKKAHLEAAELRGVVIAAAAAKTKTELQAKAVISRTFGDRKVDEYLTDDAFWAKHMIGAKLRIGSREAAMILLAARKTT